MLDLDTAEFSSTLRALQAETGRAASSMVRFWGRNAVRKLAYATPISERGFKNRGRARAGWWPAASGLGVSSVYTSFPDKGEGQFVDQLEHPSNPSVTLTNSVPYISLISGIGGATEKAFSDLTSRALSELDKAMNGAAKTAGAL